METTNFTPSANSLEVLRTIEAAGYEAYFVGGCVRDYLMGRRPADYDIATNASPDTVCSLFPNVVPTGLRFGGVTVIINSEPIEVTVYRSETHYSDSRHPDSIIHAADIITDCARRDFTINAIYWHPDKGIMDPTGQGISDLKEKIIRCVGDPEKRFREDALRILRAVRFSSQLGFDIDKDTYSAISKCAYELRKISGERIASEIKRLLISDSPEKIWILQQCGCLDAIFNKKTKMVKPDMLSTLPNDYVTRLTCFCLMTGITTHSLSYVLKLSNETMHNVRLILRCLHNPPIDDDIWLRFEISKYGLPAFRSSLEIFSIFTGKDMSDIISKLDGIKAASISNLEVDGNDLIKLGAEPVAVGNLLKVLLYTITANPQLNEKELLLNEADLLLSL